MACAVRLLVYLPRFAGILNRLDKRLRNYRLEPRVYDKKNAKSTKAVTSHIEEYFKEWKDRPCPEVLNQKEQEGKGKQRRGWMKMKLFGRSTSITLVVVNETLLPKGKIRMQISNVERPRAWERECFDSLGEEEASPGSPEPSTKRQTQMRKNTKGSKSPPDHLEFN